MLRTVKDTARLLALSELTIRRLCAANKLTYQKIGKSVRISEDEIRRFAEDCAVKRTQ